MSLNVLGVISQAMVKLGVLASGATPTADDAADALAHLNAMKRAWFGTLIGPRLSSQALSGTSGQAENGGEYVIPGGAAFTLAAPGNPRSGARFGAVDGSLGFAANNLTITHAGRLMNGLAASYVVATSGKNTRWWYRGDTGNWVLEADYATVNDAIEFPDTVIAYMPFMLAQAIAAAFSAQVTPEVQAAALEGRQVLARTYARRGRNGPDPALGLPQAAPAQGG